MILSRASLYMLLNKMDSNSVSKDGSLEAIHGLSVLRESALFAVGQT